MNEDSSINEKTIIHFKRRDPDFPLAVCSLWLFTSIVAVSQVEYATDHRKILVKYSIWELVLLTALCFPLTLGVIKKKFILALPWLLMMVYTILAKDFIMLPRMLKKIKETEQYDTLALCYLWAMALGFIAKLLICFQILGRFKYQRGGPDSKSDIVLHYLELSNDD